MCLWVSYKKKNMKKIFFFASFKVTEDPDPLVRGTDPGVQIRTKMLRILPSSSKKVGKTLFSPVS
jgi:hypothetical protein